MRRGGPHQQRARVQSSTKASGSEGLLGFILVAVIVYYFFFRDRPIELAPTVQDQIAALDRTAMELNGLSSFVAEQKRILEEQERVVQALRSERAELDPIVAANRETVKAILAAEAARHQAGVWWSRIEGFGIGVLSSLVASLLWKWFFRRRAVDGG